MGNFLDDTITKQLREIFENLQSPVEVMVFTSKKDCEYCEDTSALLEEVCALSPKLHLQKVDLEADAKLGAQYAVTRTPAVALLGQVDGKTTDFGVRFSGIPAGHEFSALVEDILAVSRQQPEISPQTQAFLDSLQSPVHLEIFTTPT